MSKFPWFLRGFVVLMVWLGLALQAQAGLTAGKEYVALNPAQPTKAGNKIEVIEFFWYGCPHCYDLEPTLNQWLGKLPKDVEFTRVPAIFRDSWVPGARIFYALDAMGIHARMHPQVFDAMHKDNVNLNDERTLFDWMGKHGVDKQKFVEAYNSFAVQAKAKQAAAMTQAYQFQGVPAVVVDGKYLTSTSHAGSLAAVPTVLDALLEKARAERGKK